MGAGFEVAGTWTFFCTFIKALKWVNDLFGEDAQESVSGELLALVGSLIFEMSVVITC